MKPLQSWSLTFLLLVSCFYPVLAVDPIETTVDVDTIVDDIAVPMCSVSSLLGVKELSVDDAIAIQGVVQQDVATSAEKYNRMSAVEELGLKVDNEDQKIIDKYNLYFVGPDGEVEYGQVLDQSLNNNNRGWLIGTMIDGRVEYGGKMGEDLILCPELPIGAESTGLCLVKEGESRNDFKQSANGFTIVDEVLGTDEVGGVLPGGSLGHSWVSMVNSLSLRGAEDPWGSVTLGQSRMKAHSWRTTMALFPESSTLLIIPRTYMYFSARMKTLGIFDMATQFVVMGSAIGSMLGSLRANTKGLQSLDNAGSMNKRIKKLFTGNVEELQSSQKTVQRQIRALKDMNPVEMVKNQEKSVQTLGEYLTQSRVFTETATTKVMGGIGDFGKADTFAGKVAGAGENVFGDVGAFSSMDGFQVYERLAGKLDKNFLLSNFGGITDMSTYTKLTEAQRVTAMTTVGENIKLMGIVPDVPGANPAMAWNELMTLHVKKSGLLNPGVCDMNALASMTNQLPPTGINDLITAQKYESKISQAMNALSSADPNTPGSHQQALAVLDDLRQSARTEDLFKVDKGIDKMMKGTIDGYADNLPRFTETVDPNTGETIKSLYSTSIDKFKVADPDVPGEFLKFGNWDKIRAGGTTASESAKRFLNGDIWYSWGMRSGHADDAVLRYGLFPAGKLLTKAASGFVKSLYTVGRKIAILGYALNLVSTLEIPGWLELASPGLTVEWDYETTGPVFTNQSSIILLGVRNNIPGLYSAGAGGYFLSSDIMPFIASLGISDPSIAEKYSNLGDNLLFGGILYNEYPQLIEVQEEKPRGITKFEEYKTGYKLSIMNWDNHAFTMLEQPSSMKEIKGTKTSSLGMRTLNTDLYAHTFGDKNEVQEVFPLTSTLAEKLSSWGLHTNLAISGSVLYTIPRIGASKYFFGVTIASALSMSIFGAGTDLLTSKTTSMQDLENCISDPEYEPEHFSCGRTRPCEEVEAACEAKIGRQSAWLAASGITQVVLDKTAVFAPLNLVLGIADYGIMEGLGGAYEGKTQATQRCLREMLTCAESSFIILGGSSYRDPDIIQAETESASQIQMLPGLEDLPIDDFIDGMNLTAPFELGQMQSNVHTEMEHATGRQVFAEIYYAHIQDATIDWLEGNLPIHLCPENEDGVDDEQCITVQGEDLIVGNKKIVSNVLVPFKWMDEEIPALVIPNTAVTVDITTDSNCDLFTVTKDGKVVFNPDIISKFSTLNFEELSRTFGTLRVIDTEKGAIYPNIDYNGDLRFEMNHEDGAFYYSEDQVEVTANAKTLFNDKEYAFNSAVFAGGTIVKRGDVIYILPKYFRPIMSGRQWLEQTQGRPLVSDTGEQLEAFDDQGNLMGINAGLTRIPGAEKLGILTRLDAEKDLNGDGIISDEEKSGWRFYSDEEGNAKFDLWYNGIKETYDADQIEIDEETGAIKVYEKDTEHVEANLLRSLETKVDSLGRTLFTIKDGQGNVLLEEALVTHLKGTGGAIRYDPDNNNYIFVNGQPVELNNEFKTNGFNPITGRTDPPLLQPSSTSTYQTYKGAEDETQLPAIPSRPEETLPLLVYLLALVVGITTVHTIKKKKKWI